MAIPIEGLVPREPNQEKNDAFLPKAPLSLDGTTDILSSQGGKRDRRARATRAQSIFLAGLTTFSPLLAACGERQVSAGTSPSVQEATAEAFIQQNPDVSNVYNPVESNPELSATAEAQKPTTPETQKEASCGIVDTELCKTAEIIETKTGQGISVKMAALKLKEGEAIYSNGAFQVAKAEIAQPATFKGYSTTLTIPGNRTLTYTMIGDIKFDNMLTTNVNGGEIIGRVGNKGITNLGDYNLLIYVSRFDPNTKTFSSADDVLESLFPNAFKKPPKVVSAQTPSNQAITYTDTFRN